MTEPEAPGILGVEDRMHTVKETAAIFGCEVQTVRIWLRNGDLKGVKYGKKWMVSRAAMAAKVQKDNS